MNTIPIIIPGGMTKLLQPLDISVNRSFKAVLRNIWESWMTDGKHSFTATGRMRCAKFGEVAEWVATAWKAVTVRTIVAGFEKAKIIQKIGEKDDSEIEKTTTKMKTPAVKFLNTFIRYSTVIRKTKILTVFLRQISDNVKK